MFNKKESKKFFESVQFDTVENAENTARKAAKKLEKAKIGLIIAGVATALSALGFSFEVLGFLLPIAFLAAIAAYIVGGGIKIALKTAWKIAKFGWFVIPFPYDIVTGIVTLIFAIMGFIFFPVVFVLVNFFQIKKTLNEAEEFLGYSVSDIKTEPVSENA